MKKIKNLLIVLSALVFGLSVVLISAKRVSQAQVLGEVVGEVEGQMDTGNMESIEVTKDTEKKEVDYYLPYPGILPDHPLYWLKMIRDRIMLLLTPEPVAKFDRLLLYADKRLGAAQALIEGGKKELGVATATKGEKYLERTVTQFKQIKDQGKATPELTERLRKATLKHEEVLQKVLEKVPDQAKSAIQEAIEKSRHGYETVMQVREREQEQEQEQEREREEGSESEQEQEQEKEQQGGNKGETKKQ